MITNDQPLAQLLVVLVAGLGALNWGLVEATGTDLLVEAGLQGANLGYAYLAIGVAGAIVLIDMLDIIADNGAETSPLED